MPPHLLHLLQPLDVGCFAPLKKAYRRQAEDLMRNRITHITKTKFLLCFKGAFDAAITKSNILGGFQGASLVQFDLEAMILKLDVRLRTPPLPTVNNSPWESKTPRNTLELGSQLTLVKQRIQRHLDSSPTSMVSAFEQLAKGVSIVAHRLVLAQARITKLKAANKASARQKLHKRKWIQQKGTLTVEEGAQLAALQEFGARGDGKKGKKRARADEGNQRKCGNCGKTGTGHNTQTCKNNPNSP
jgi:hypothetical protein